jgi:hypothetical protein
MKITNFTYSGPDSDNDMSFDCTAAIENGSDFAVEMVKSSLFILNNEGVCVGGNHDDEEDTFIDPKDSGTIDLRTGWGGFKGYVFNEEYNKIKILADAILYRREFTKLGTIDTPKTDDSASFVTKKTTISGLVDILGVVISRSKPDDDGDVRVDVNCGIRNISNTHIEKASIKIVLIDQEDAQIEDSEESTPIPPHTSKILTPNFFRLKTGKLRNSSVRITASIYLPVGHATGEAIAKKEKR